MKGIHNELLKQQAIKLRKKGYSYPMIEKKLAVPRATLSGWFKGMILSDNVKNKLLKRKRIHLAQIRKKAVLVLKKQREEYLDKIRSEIIGEMGSIQFTKSIKELLLTILYLGEGFKRKSIVGLGNSNPKIIHLFVTLLRDVYDISEDRITCYLHLRSDQNVVKETLYWSKVVGVEKKQFRKPQFDKRTKGNKTWENYHGVCVVYCNYARIEKRLTILQDLILNKF